MSIRHTVVAAATSGSTQDIEIGSAGQPEGFWIFATRGTVAGTSVSGAHLAFCCGDGTNYWGTGMAGEGAGIAATDEIRASWNDAQTTSSAMGFVDSTIGVDGYCSITARASWPTNGIQLTWGSNPSAGYLLHVVFIDAANVKVGTATRNNSIGGTTTLTPGFAADNVCLGGLKYLTDGGGAWTAGSYFSLGWADYNGSGEDNYGMSLQQPDNAASSASAGECMNVNTVNVDHLGGHDDAIEVTDMRSGAGSNEIVCTSRDQAGNDSFGWIAIKWETGVVHDLVAFDSSTSTGNKDITGSLGDETPEFALIYTSGAAAYETFSGTLPYGAMGSFSHIGASAQSSVNWYGSDGEADMYHRSMSTATALAAAYMTTSETPTNVFVASLDSMITNGVRLNYTTTDTGAVRKHWALLVGSSATPPTITDHDDTDIAAIGDPQSIAMVVTITDGSSATIRFQCTAGKGTCDLPDLDSGVTHSAGTRGSSDVTFSGTKAQVIAAGLDFEYTAVLAGADTGVIVTVDDGVNTAVSQTFTITNHLFYIDGTPAQINAALATLSVMNTAVETTALSFVAIDDGDRTGSGSTNIITSLPSSVSNQTTLVVLDDIITILG